MKLLGERREREAEERESAGTPKKREDGRGEEPASTDREKERVSVRAAIREKQREDSLKDSAGSRSSNLQGRSNKPTRQQSFHPLRHLPLSVYRVSFATTTGNKCFLSGSQRFWFLNVFL